MRLDKEAVIEGRGYFFHLVLKRPGEQIDVLLNGPTVLTLLLYILVNHCAFIRALLLQVFLPIDQALHTLGFFESGSNRSLNFIW